MMPVIIEVAISIIVVYFILSTLVTFIVEAIAVVVNIRGNTKMGYKTDQFDIKTTTIKKRITTR